MALAQLVVGVPLQCRSAVGRRRRELASGGVPSVACGASGGGRVAQEISSESRASSGRREVAGQAKMKVPEAAVEGGQIRPAVEIPVTCYQLLGVTAKAEKDEIVKAVMELKGSDIEDGYTKDVAICRQELLMDLRDKLLFEPEYAGNIKEKVPPKCSLRMPWAWLPGALCLLQEAGEEKLVLDIGRVAIQIAEAKPYIHDLLLSMALAECSIAKEGFEANKISQGFEALARAQHLLKSKASLEKMPLLYEIEESLEELAPACTLELLALPQIPDNSERRRGAISALHELLRQALDVESSSRVQDWPSFLNQAMKRLTATDIVDLLSWDTLAVVRKNKKSLESQNQRVVLDFNCFYFSMIAHIAVGFATRQTEMISKARSICECLMSSEGVDLKFEEAFCLFLLGQGSAKDAFEKFSCLEVNRASASRSLEQSNVLEKDKDAVNRKLETWLGESVLSLFADTRDCSPSLANFFGNPKWILTSGKRKLETTKVNPSSGLQESSYGILPGGGITGSQAAHINSARSLGEAVKQLAPTNIQEPRSVNRNTSVPGPSFHLKRNLNPRFLQIWCGSRSTVGKVAYTAIAGCILFSAIRLFGLQLGRAKTPYELLSSQPCMTKETVAWTLNHSPSFEGMQTFMTTDFWGSLWKTLMRSQLKHPTTARSFQTSRPSDNISPLPVVTGTVLKKRQMDLEEAEELVKLWQEIKAEALGPKHQIQMLPEILQDSMLSQWRELANSAKASSSFWRFVLLKLTVLHAEILLDGVEDERAEIEAVLEEAAELVDESEPKKPSYYSTYKVQYRLRKQEDGSWRFVEGHIQNLT